jgi:hypothetical protein
VGGLAVIRIIRFVHCTADFLAGLFEASIDFFAGLVRVDFEFLKRFFGFAFDLFTGLPGFFPRAIGLLVGVLLIGWRTSPSYHRQGEHNRNLHGECFSTWIAKPLDIPI